MLKIIGLIKESCKSLLKCKQSTDTHCRAWRDFLLIFFLFLASFSFPLLQENKIITNTLKKKAVNSYSS